MPSGFEIGPQSCATTRRFARDAAGLLIDLDFGDHRDVAVVAFVEDARDAAAAGDAGSRGARPAATAARPSSAAFAAACDDLVQPRVAQVAQPVRDRIGLHVRRDFVHEALVRERVLQARRRSQRPGEERRRDRVREHALARDRAGAAARAADAAGHVRRRGVAAVVERGRRARRRRRGANGAGSNPASKPVTTLPGAS